MKVLQTKQTFTYKLSNVLISSALWEILVGILPSGDLWRQQHNTIQTQHDHNGMSFLTATHFFRLAFINWSRDCFRSHNKTVWPSNGMINVKPSFKASPNTLNNKKNKNGHQQVFLVLNHACREACLDHCSLSPTLLLSPVLWQRNMLCFIEIVTA